MEMIYKNLLPEKNGYDPKTNLFYAENLNKDLNISSLGIFFIPTNLDYLTLVRDYIEKKLKQLNLKENEIFDLTLIIEELLANAIISTKKSRDLESILLKWSKEGQSFFLKILDYGGGLDINKVIKERPQGNNLDTFLKI